jgi:hypothetical protein
VVLAEVNVLESASYVAVLEYTTLVPAALYSLSEVTRPIASITDTDCSVPEPVAAGGE